MSPETLGELAKLGFQGLVIGALCWAYLGERKRNDALQLKVDALQEKRVDIGERALTAQAQTTTVLSGLTDLIRSLPRGRSQS